MDGQRVLDLVDGLDDLGIAVWLDGGWGIDALLGTQTRPHDDLDLLVRLDDVPQLVNALAGIGYMRVHGEPPLSFEMTDVQGHQVDIHPVRFTTAGEAIYTMSNGEDWVYPPGAALDAAHRDDVAALAERFDLPMPPFKVDVRSQP